MPTSRHGVFTLSSQMWEKELSDHHRKVNVVKAVVTNTGPLLTALPGTTPRRGAPPSRKGGARSELPPASLTSTEPSPSQGKSSGLNALSSSERRVCDDVILVLERMTSADSKALLEEIFVASEMRKLLARYSGVFPTLGSSEDQKAEAEGEPAVAVAQKPAPPPEKKPTEASLSRRHSTGGAGMQKEPAAVPAPTGKRDTPPSAAPVVEEESKPIRQKSSVAKREEEPAAVKPVERKLSVVKKEEEPAAVKPVERKSSVVKKEEEPAAVKPVERKPSVAKKEEEPATVKPVERKSSVAKKDEAPSAVNGSERKSSMTKKDSTVNAQRRSSNVQKEKLPAFLAEEEEEEEEEYEEYEEEEEGEYEEYEEYEEEEEKPPNPKQKK
jgi:hypothetical protein